LEVIHTQIILAVVGALLMLVIGESLARACGIVGEQPVSFSTVRASRIQRMPA